MEPDDYVAYLAKQARSGLAVFHEFVLSASGDGSIHSFVEGEEDSFFYGPFIRQFADGAPINFYVCDGKAGVASLALYIRDAGYHQSERCLFFADRDYDDHFEGQPVVDDLIYITDPYSVENHLTCDRTLDVVVRDICGFSDRDPETARILAAFQVGRTAYRRHLLTALAWAVACREAGLRPTFANVQLNKVYSVGRDGCVLRRATGFRAYRRACIGDGPSPPFAAVRKWVRAFRAMPPTLWVRGKFELWFFETLTVSIVGAAVAEAKARGRKRVRVPASIIQRHSFDLLGGRVPSPPSLDAYLERRLAA